MLYNYIIIIILFWLADEEDIIEISGMQGTLIAK
jgi:hypothetical protein